VPAGKFECFKLKLDLGQTFWISNDEHRYIVRFEAGGVAANLLEVRVAKKGETTFEHDRLSATLPEGWYGYKRDQPDSEVARSRVMTPNVNAVARFECGPATDLLEEHKTAKAWLEHSFKQNKKYQKNFEVNTDGITKVTLDGREGLLATISYEKDNRSMQGLRWVVLDDELAFKCRVDILADDFDEMIAAFEKIVASVKLK